MFFPSVDKCPKYIMSGLKNDETDLFKVDMPLITGSNVRAPSFPGDWGQ